GIGKKAQQFGQQIDRSGKPIFVICHGPWLLVSANLAKGRTITSWPTLQDDLRNAGATWQDKECLVDRNWVSSRKPDDLPAFNREIVRMLEQAQLGKELRSAAAGDELEVRA